jgi:hypothetical protein
MANVLSDKEKKRLENQKKWAMRTKEAAPRVKNPVTREARINELRDLILSSANGKAMVTKVMEIALDDNHPGQMSAMKMVIDRIIPQSAFEAAKNEARTAIQITISGLDTTINGSHQSNPPQADVIDV